MLKLIEALCVEIADACGWLSDVRSDVLFGWRESSFREASLLEALVIAVPTREKLLRAALRSVVGRHEPTRIACVQNNDAGPGDVAPPEMFVLTCHGWISSDIAEDSLFVTHTACSAVVENIEITSVVFNNLSDIAEVWARIARKLKKGEVTEIADSSDLAIRSFLDPSVLSSQPSTVVHRYSSPHTSPKFVLHALLQLCVHIHEARETDQLKHANRLLEHLEQLHMDDFKLLILHERFMMSVAAKAMGLSEKEATNRLCRILELLETAIIRPIAE